MNSQFSYNTYMVRKKIITFAGAKFHIFNPNGEVVFFSKMKAFKLKEDLRVFTSEEMTNELINIKARKAIDFSSVYDVFDTQSGEKVGALQRKGMKSILRDEWSILDNFDNVIGYIVEDSAALAIVRRFLTNLIPQKYHIKLNNVDVAQFKQNFNPFVIKLNLDFTLDVDNIFDKRLGIAAGILLCAIEGKQN